MQKYVLMPKTIFDFAYLSYYQHKTGIQDEGCGRLKYRPNFFEDELDQYMVYERILDRGRRDNIRYWFHAFDNRLVSTYNFTINM